MLLVLCVRACVQGGMYVLQLMDHYSAGFCVLIIAIVECFVINWIYGALLTADLFIRSYILCYFNFSHDV